MAWLAVWLGYQLFGSHPSSQTAPAPNPPNGNMGNTLDNFSATNSNAETQNKALLGLHRQLVRDPHGPESVGDKFMHEMKAWALKVLKQNNRERVRHEERTILRVTPTGYEGLVPSKIKRTWIYLLLTTLHYITMHTTAPHYPTPLITSLLSSLVLKYKTCCGWGNQIVYLLYAMDIASKLNRVLVVCSLWMISNRKGINIIRIFRVNVHVNMSFFVFV